jgi:hypothetical protein
MKKMLVATLGASVGFAVAAWVVSDRLTMRHAMQLAEQQAAWQAEKTALRSALEASMAHSKAIAVSAAPTPAAAPAVPTKLSPAEIVAKLLALKSPPANQTRASRQVIYWLEELIAAGPAALPAIRDFLNRNEDIDFAPVSQGRVGRSGNLDSILPLSLRFGLFDAAKQIGGVQAETLLAEVLGATGRGVEVAWLARTLQEIAPNKYRDVALAAARELLARPLMTNLAGPLDRNEREQLFSVLTLYGDTSYVGAAQAQLLRADGEVDRSALRYLQQSLGQQSVPLAAQWYDDPRLTDPAKKEPFARLALNYVGTDTQANEFYQKAINDMALSKDHRRNLIEDLNQDGFPDPRNLTARDLPLIQNRIALIEQLAPNAADPVNAAAFKEAYKDLLNMRDRVTRPPRPAP